MNLDQASIPIATSQQSQNQGDTRLRGGWLILARAVWILLITLSLVVSIAALPLRWRQLHTICVGSSCSQLLTIRIVQDLHHLNLSVDFFASYIIMLESSSLLVWVAVALLIFWRRSNDRIALLVALFLVLFPAAQGIESPAAVGAAYPSLQGMTHLLDVLGWLFFLSFFFLFPDGRFVPRWTVVLLGTYVLLNILIDLFHTLPFAKTISLPLNLPLLAVMVGIGLISQVYRYKRISSAVQRQQSKWVVYGVVLTILLFTSIVALGNIFFPAPPLIPLLAAYTAIDSCELLIPLSIGFSILRYRLWDIDIIINRTIVYGTLTASIIGLYVLLVTALGTVLRAEGNLLISLFATGLVAVLFQPLRELLQRGVNRLLYGQRDEPYTVITQLSQRLKGTLEPEAVLSTIVETVAQALKLPYAAILWKQEEIFELAASYGKPSGEPVVLPLVYQAETIGQLQLAPRTPGEAFTPADMHLLDELSRQAGLAAHAVRLATDLQKARERLVLAREEERRRLRRDLHDGVGPTLASLSQRIDTASHLVSCDPDAAIVLLGNLKTQIKSTIGDIRRVVYALRPPVLDELGLVSAIREHVMLLLQEVNGLHVSVEAPADLPLLPAAVEVAAYRITLEALTNVERHAHAQHCLVCLELADERSLCLSIIDDGRGLHGDYHAGVGITSMRERVAELGGEFNITAKPGGSTHVQVLLPLKS